MKRVLYPWLIVAVVYAATLHFTYTVSAGSDDTTPSYTAADDARDAPAQTASPQPVQVEEVHAAVVDMPQVISLPQAFEAPSEDPASSRLSGQTPSNADLNETELVKVNSAANIRGGPSASAEIIGTAQAGAEVQVASRDSGWVQVIDPGSWRAGWIHSKFLPASGYEVASSGATPHTEMASDQPSKYGAAKLKSRSAARAGTETNSLRAWQRHAGLLPDEVEKLLPLGEGVFGIFGKRGNSRR
jgi:uncharacterized protein YraI